MVATTIDRCAEISQVAINWLRTFSASMTSVSNSVEDTAGVYIQGASMKQSGPLC